MTFFVPGEVKIPTEREFLHFKNLCDDDEGWKKEYHKDATYVFQKYSGDSSFKMFKARSVMHRVRPETLYDVVHDARYRKTWDKQMIEGREICYINGTNDIGYYALKAIPPVQNRDFVTQRSWHVEKNGDETTYIIFNHSVCHKSMPPKKDFIRGISFLTGYIIRRYGDNGTQFTYVSQSDPKGSLPAWLINKLTTFFGPRLLQRLTEAAEAYPEWKAQNDPHCKPWLYTDQQEMPQVDWNDVTLSSEQIKRNLIDCKGPSEDVDKDEFDDNKSDSFETCSEASDK